MSLLERVDERVRGPIQVTPERRVIQRRQLERVERSAHMSEPALAGIRRDLERDVTHPKPRVSALLTVDGRPAPVLLEEAAQPVDGPGEVMLWVQRPQNGVGLHPVVEPRDEKVERGTPADLLEQLALHRGPVLADAQRDGTLLP